jgi:hypothetical protein
MLIAFQKNLMCGGTVLVRHEFPTRNNVNKRVSIQVEILFTYSQNATMIRVRENE